MRPYCFALFFCIFCLTALFFFSAKTVVGQNHPLAADDSAAMLGAYQCTFVNLLTNDSPPSGDNLFMGYVTDLTNGTHGGVSQGGAGQVRYCLYNYDYEGYDSFTYRACTRSGNCSDYTATVSIFVVPPNSLGKFCK